MVFWVLEGFGIDLPDLLFELQVLSAQIVGLGNEVVVQAHGHAAEHDHKEFHELDRLLIGLSVTVSRSIILFTEE